MHQPQSDGTDRLLRLTALMSTNNEKLHNYHKAKPFINAQYNVNKTYNNQYYKVNGTLPSNIFDINQIGQEYIQSIVNEVRGAVNGQ